jgi:hypothetical protein
MVLLASVGCLAASCGGSPATAPESKTAAGESTRAASGGGAEAVRGLELVDVLQRVFTG